MSLQQAWGEITSSPVVCPGDWYSGDMRVAYGWMWRDYCNSCGPLTRWYYDIDERTWSWQISCYYEEPMYGKPYTIYLGTGIEHGYSVHSVYSIYENGTVHGLNCSCTGTHY